MKRKGICYDAGRVMMGREWRPVFDPEVVHRELEIIKRDLHCNAVRICGYDIGRLMTAAEDALAQGLEVWFCPELWDSDERETLDYVEKAAASAERLSSGRQNQVVFSVGSELTLFMQGILEGGNVFERLAHPSLRERVKAGKHNAPLNAFLAEANEAVRDVFHGKVTYASVPFEAVDWSLFDFVCVDLYREKRIKDQYTDLLKRWFAYNKPVVIGEFGCCTYRGAGDAGGRGWDIVDWTTVPPKLKGEYVYDQSEQARELSDQLNVLDQAGVDGAFVFTFVQPPQFQDEAEKQMLKNVAFDLDIVNYSLVKSSVEGRHGTFYPDVPWEPKESFNAVAEYYAAH